MKMTFGAFKEVYRNNGIYWDGEYNVEGSGSYPTLAAARAAVDAHIARLDEQEAREKANRIGSGDYLVATRKPDDSVTIQTPKGMVEYKTMREARQNVFKLEEQFDMELIWS